MILSYQISCEATLVRAITRTLDILVVEMMVEGILIYINTLCKDSTVAVKPKNIMPGTSITTSHPGIMIRRRWKSYDEVPKSNTFGSQADGIVCVGGFRNLRMKEPTIDLICNNGVVYASDVVNRVAYGPAHESMMEGCVYEFRVTQAEKPGDIILSKPVKGLIKKMHNTPEIVTRSFISAINDSSMSTVLYDVTSVSIKVRRMVY